MKLWSALEAQRALVTAGLVRPDEAVDFDARSNRICARVPGNKIAWFPTSAEGQRLLAKERRVLRLLEVHCHFPVPRVLLEHDSGWELRSFLPGMVQAPGLRERIQCDASFARVFGEDLGRILADQHAHVPSADLQGWLDPVPNWPRPEDLPTLPEVVQDGGLLRRIHAALEQRQAARDDHPVLVHADFGFHNIIVDPASLKVTGIIDYEGAVCGERHQDFAYLLMQRPDEPLLEGAIAAYESTTGWQIDRARVKLLNAIAAIGFLGFRHGHPPEEVWCGRTLDQDLAWTRTALAFAGL